MREFDHENDAIIFDLGGVLIDWSPTYLYKKIFVDAQQMQRFLDEICTFSWNEQQDAGRPFADGIAELVRQHPQYEKEISAYFHRWPEMVAGAIEGTVEILNALHAQGYALHALSNWSAETFPFVREAFAFFEQFQSIVLSGEEKRIKPDPEFYNVLLSRINKPATSCLFIDDSAKNIAAAKTMGFRTIHFSSPAQLRAELKGSGINL